MLTLIIFLPLIFGLAILFTPRQHARTVALAAMTADLLLVLYAASAFNWAGITEQVSVFGNLIDDNPFQFRTHVPWLEEFGISYTVGADNLSMLMVILTACLGIFGVLCSWSSIEKREKEFYFFLLLLQTGIMGTFLALDMFLFYIFWELMLIPLYFMIGIWGSKNRIYATMKFVMYTLVGSLLMLIAIIWMYYNNGYFSAGLNDFVQVKTYSYELMYSTQRAGGLEGSFNASFWPFLALFLAFAIKVPLFPFHTWLPDAHTEAPTAGSVILAGVLLKTGGYGIIRFCLPLFPEAAISFAPLITWMAVIAIIYGAMTAIVQTDMKRLVAYSSVSHMGFVILGIFSMNSQGMSGAILQMINHGIATSGLFLAVGMIYERRHTREMSEFGGLAHNLPVFAVLTMVMVLSSVGLPGLNGFMGEFPILLGSMHNEPMLLAAQAPGSSLATLNMTHYTWLVAALAATGVIFGAVYLLIMYQRTFFGKLDEAKNGSLKDLVPREWGQLVALSIAALWIGLYPLPIWKAIQPATDQTLAPLTEHLQSLRGEPIVLGEHGSAGHAPLATTGHGEGGH